ncbi:MAG: tetraacyldisaccharide 4'-kinase [Acidobacteria bacterium]|nr:tetraacyldisaccharide 4'-kinase [Acidobacteriota bacterium]
MFSWLYGVITSTRNFLYTKEILKSVSLEVLVISIGNITVGGTGKTPLVALAAKILAENGERVCILSRGYGRTNPRKRVLVSDGENVLTDAFQAGDEPFELACQLLGKAIVVADPNRAAAGRWARETLAVTAFVLDDAFQHLRVKRDLNIVTIDATKPFGNGKMLPSGILREPLVNLKRADAIVLTRANLVDENLIANLKRQILEINVSCKIFVAENKTSQVIDLNDFHAQMPDSRGQTIDQAQLKTENCIAFCGLGNPDSFFEQMRREEFTLAAEETFSDHYFYKQTDVFKLEAKAIKKSAKFLLTTAKDAVKLKKLNFTMLCYVVKGEIILDNPVEFSNLILSVLREKTELRRKTV